MHLFSGKPPAIFILAVLFTTLMPPTVRSSPNVIKLPSDQSENDFCPLDSKPDLCPVKCFRPDPVCGVDGVTYWCGCAEAHCAGARVKKIGFCEVGNGGSGPVVGSHYLADLAWGICVVWASLTAFNSY